MSGAGGRRRSEPPPRQALELLVFGYEVRFFHNPTLAADIEAGRHLMPCQGREDILVDRFDVRLLLENFDQLDRFPASASLSERERIEEAELDKLRYEDMEAAEARVMEEEAKKRAAAGEGFHMVGFKYENEAKPEESPASSAIRLPAEETPAVPFAPPFAVLPGMILPSTARLHSIIDTTAKFVHKQGEQAEVRLRLQHKDNPSFSFLLIDDPLHLYYKFVRTLIKEGVETAIPPPPPAASTSVTVTAPTAAPPPSTELTPPAEGKAIIDKLVEAVLKHGDAFEATVRQREGSNPRFAFLHPSNEWNTYYRKKLVVARALATPIPAAAPVTGLALLAAYSDDEEDTKPAASVQSNAASSAPPQPTPPPPPAAAAGDDATKEALKKQRLLKAKLLASKLSAATSASATSQERSRARSPSFSPVRDRSASPRRRAAS